ENECNHSHDPHPDITAYTRKPVIPRPDDMHSIDAASYMHDGPSGDAPKKDLSCDFLQSDKAQADQPWMLWTGWLAPHDPYKAQQQYLDLYPPASVAAPQFPDNWQDNEHPAMYQTRVQRCCEKVISSERHQHDRAAYYAMITELDGLVGEVLYNLEASGELENTVIIFTSDHGDMMGEHGMYYKYTPYDASAKIPLIIAGPGFPAGKTIETPVSLVDLHATIVDIAGAKQIDGCRGSSLLPLINGDTSGHPFVYMELNTERLDTGIFSIVKDNWKYNYYADYDDQLFNLAEDPNEWDNCIDKSECQDIAAELKALLFKQVDPDAISTAAFADQKQRLTDYLQSDRRTAQEIIDSDIFNGFSWRLGQEAAEKFIKDHAQS
ncbi:MAG: sulfatase-like hydrolase/transferase, partial [Planctomycetes bacterium]|nr:sulfatase-like hydrolase/transferase [Planctomycetota bacterium]